MRALLYTGPEKMEIVDRQKPSPAANEALLKVKYVGICGSDVHGYLGTTGRRIPPMIMGHEFSAEVVEIGNDVKNYKVGDRVTALPLISCGECFCCKNGDVNVCDNRQFLGTMSLDGVLCEYICIEESKLYKLPETVDDRIGALIEPFAVAYHAVSKALPVKGKTVMIAGAGTIGLLVQVVAKHFGAGKIVMVDLSEDRLAAAKKMGADITINPGSQDMDEVLTQEGIRKSVDVTIECVGITPTAQQTINYVRNTGTVVWVGNSAQMININMQQIVTRELTVYGTYIYQPKDYAESIALLAKGEIDISGFVSAEVGMGDAEAMFKRLAGGDTTMIKVLVDVRK